MPGKKEPIYTRMNFTVAADGELADLVDFLERFYRAPLLHEIKRMDIRRPLTALIDTGPQRQNPNTLHVEMNVEALVLAGADKRKQLLPAVDWTLAGVDVLASLCSSPTGLIMLPSGIGPTGPLGPPILAAPARQYGSIAAKDIFFGPTILEQVAEKIDATEEELEHELEHMAGHSGESAEVLRARLTKQGALDRMKAKLRSDKTLDWLAQNSRIRTVAAAAAK